MRVVTVLTVGARATKQCVVSDTTVVYARTYQES